MRFIHTKSDNVDSVTVQDEGKNYEYRPGRKLKIKDEKHEALLLKAREKRVEQEEHTQENRSKNGKNSSNNEQNNDSGKTFAGNKKTIDKHTDSAGYEPSGKTFAGAVKDYSVTVTSDTKTESGKVFVAKNYEYSDQAQKTIETAKQTIETVNPSNYVPKTSTLAKKALIKSIKKTKSAATSAVKKETGSSNRKSTGSSLDSETNNLSKFLGFIMAIGMLPLISFALIAAIIFNIVTLFAHQEPNYIVRESRYAQYQELHSAMYDIETSYYADCVDYCSNENLPIPSEVGPVDWANVIGLAFTLMSCQADYANDGAKQVAYHINAVENNATDVNYWSETFFNTDTGNVYHENFDVSDPNYLYKDGWEYVPNFFNSWTYNHLNTEVCVTSNEFDISVPCLYNAFFILYYECPGCVVTNSSGTTDEALSGNNKLLVRGNPLLVQVDTDVEYSTTENLYNTVEVYSPADPNCPSECVYRTDNNSQWSHHSHIVFSGTQVYTNSGTVSMVKSAPRTTETALTVLSNTAASNENNYWNRFFNPEKDEFNCLYLVGATDIESALAFYNTQLSNALEDADNDGIKNLLDPDFSWINAVLNNPSIYSCIYDMTSLEAGDILLVEKISQWAQSVHQQSTIQAMWKETVIYIASMYAENHYVRECSELPLTLPGNATWRSTNHVSASYRGSGYEFRYDWYPADVPTDFRCYAHGRAWNSNWCDAFVSWLANYNGIIHSSIYSGMYSPSANLIAAGYFEYQETVSETARYYNNKNLLIPVNQMDSIGYTPQTGDIAIITRDGNTHSTFSHPDFKHIAIVLYMDGNTLYTLEGNTGSTYLDDGSLDGYVAIQKRDIRNCNVAYFAAPFGYY